ncbi:hypothetical protein V8C86DRAFT_2517004 [Haematococcus lacustris]
MPLLLPCSCLLPCAAGAAAAVMKAVPSVPELSAKVARWGEGREERVEGDEAAGGTEWTGRQGPSRGCWPWHQPDSWRTTCLLLARPPAATATKLRAAGKKGFGTPEAWVGPRVAGGLVKAACSRAAAAGDEPITAARCGSSSTGAQTTEKSDLKMRSSWQVCPEELGSNSLASLIPGSSPGGGTL